MELKYFINLIILKKNPLFINYIHILLFYSKYVYNSLNRVLIQKDAEYIEIVRFIAALSNRK